LASTQQTYSEHAQALLPKNRPYQPFGSAREILLCKAPEVLASGPAGTGKSKAWLEKLHALAEIYAGMRGLIVRKTRASLTDTALVTFETKVVPEGHPILSGAQRANRHSYLYPNGSELVLGGMDKPERVLSSEYDIIYPQEAIELTENDWETLTTRLRNGVMPYQQIGGDTNPDKPTHWLKARCDRGQTLLIESRHEDNPTLWNIALGAWTPTGASYIAKLDTLTGPRKARLRYGIWAGAEGTIYEDVWDSAVHVIDRRSIPSEWDRYWVVDFGFVHPFVWQEWAIGPDGEAYLVHEIHRTKTLVEDHAKRILALTEYWRLPRDEKGQRLRVLLDSEELVVRAPKAIICDHDAEDRATLERHLRMTTKAARKSVSDGIQAVAARLRAGDNGRPRIFFFRDALESVDKELLEASRPISTVAEFDGYVWDTSTAGLKKGDKPLKENDDGMDATRYMVAELDLGRPTVPFY
jgi:Phage terminase large subunit